MRRETTRGGEHSAPEDNRRKKHNNNTPAGAGGAAAAAAIDDSIVEELVGAGIDLDEARRLAAHPNATHERVTWAIGAAPSRSTKNQAGWIIVAIRKGYDIPAEVVEDHRLDDQRRDAITLTDHWNEFDEELRIDLIRRAHEACPNLASCKVPDARLGGAPAALAGSILRVLLDHERKLILNDAINAAGAFA